MHQFDGWEVRIIEHVRYDDDGNPQYSYEPNMRRKETRGWFARFVGAYMSHQYKKFYLANSPDTPMIFFDPNEAFYAAIVSLWRWRVSMMKGEQNDRIM